MTQAKVLIIAGSDPCGGAGLQADIKTVTALGGYAMAAPTALTVQNTVGVRAVHQLDGALISQQISCIAEDIEIGAVKIGMVGAPEAVAAIAAALSGLPKSVSVVLDPVLVATSGAALAQDGVAAAINDLLVPISRLVTPNTDEAMALVGRDVNDRSSMVEAGRALVEKGAGSALIKGGHLAGPMVTDILVTPDGETAFANERLGVGEIHGGGCTLSTAIATGLAGGLSLEDAVGQGIAYTHGAIAAAAPVGAGAMPLNHAFRIATARGRASTA